MNNIYIKKTLVPLTNIQKTKDILEELTLENIIDQFDKFKYKCFNSPTSIFGEIDYLLPKLFMTKYGQINFKYTISTNDTIRDDGSNDSPYHFRIRKIKQDKLIKQIYKLSNNDIYENLHFTEMDCENDLWAKPPALVLDYSRLNKPNQSILYTSMEGSTTLTECNINVNEYFFIICYKRIKPITFSDCYRFIAFNELTEEENSKRYIIFNLLKNEFVRIFPKTYYEYEQCQYCISSKIAEYFFINDNVDGIQYPSVKNIGAFNFAFKGISARECLNPVCIKFCKLLKPINGKKGTLEILTNGFWQNNKFIWTTPESSLSKKLLDISLDMYLYK